MVSADKLKLDDPQLLTQSSAGVSPAVVSPPERRSSSPDGILWMPKNRSTGNLLAQSGGRDDKRIRFSFDASSLGESLAKFVYPL